MLTVGKEKQYTVLRRISSPTGWQGWRCCFEPGSGAANLETTLTHYVIYFNSYIKNSVDEFEPPWGDI